MFVVFERDADPCIIGVYNTREEGAAARLKVAEGWADEVLQTGDPQDVFGRDYWEENDRRYLINDALRTLEIEEVK